MPSVQIFENTFQKGEIFLAVKQIFVQYLDVKAEFLAE